jgi:hypothetical protein
MINLLTTPLSQAELVTLFRSRPARSPLPVFGDPRWQEAFSRPVLVALRDALLARAAAEIEAPPPPLTDELYREFAATGASQRFSQVLFERRRLFGRSAIALLAAGPAATPAGRGTIHDLPRRNALRPGA